MTLDRRDLAKHLSFMHEPRTVPVVLSSEEVARFLEAAPSHRWIACRPGFFLPVRVLSRLFRRLLLEKLVAAHQAGALQFFGKHAPLTNAQAFAAR